MTRSLKKPKLFTKAFRIKNKMTIIAQISKRKENFELSEIQFNILNLKTDFDEFNNKINSLKDVLKTSKDNYGCSTFINDDDFLKLSSNTENFSTPEDNKKTNENIISTSTITPSNTQTINSVNQNNPSSTSLMVIKSQSLLNLGESTKKVAKFSLKSFLVSITLTLINLFI